MKSMAIRPILLLGNPLLRAVSRPAANPAEALPVLADLEDTLAEFRRNHGFGRGISAIQIGVDLRIIFLCVDGVRYELINPIYLERSAESFELWDDCFSFPDLMVWLRRASTVRIQYLDPSGALRELTAHGSLSELIQHEMDHLDGVLAIDHAIGRDSLALRAELIRQKQLKQT
jgi:peptide deformylase